MEALSDFSNTCLPSPLPMSTLWAVVKRADFILRHQCDYSPNNKIVNETLSDLVDTLCHVAQSQLQYSGCPPGDIMETLNSLPRLCALAECEMEKWWAKKWLIEKPSLSAALQQFWYTSQYQCLVKAEANMLITTKCTDAVFLGSGALPLTAILMSQQENRAMNIVCVDQDAESCELASELIGSWGLNNFIQIEHGSAQEYVFQNDALAVCASLLKATNLYQRLHEQGIQNLIVRDAEFPYTFLYSPAPIPNKQYYVEQRRTQCSAERINITRLFQRV